MQSLKTLINAVKVWADSRFAKKTDIIEPVNADWDCNDPNDPSYIKNRICGIEQMESELITSYHYNEEGYIVYNFVFDGSSIGEWYFTEEFECVDVYIESGDTFHIQRDNWDKYIQCDNGDIHISYYNGKFTFRFYSLVSISDDETTARFVFTHYVQVNSKYLANSYNKMDKNNPVGSGSFSMNRRSSSNVGQYSVAEGYDTTASGFASHAEGDVTKANGKYSHAECKYTTASGDGSHAEGYYTNASEDYSHAEGIYTTASGVYSHAEGCNTIASGYASHAEGHYTKSSSTGSHAEGYRTTASGYSSHADGYYTTASGSNSFASGYYTTAQRKSQSAHGEYNVLDTTGTTSTRGSYVTIVGNGTSSTSRSNAHTLDWSGNAWFAGDVYVGSTGGKNKDAGSVKLAKMTDLHSHSNKTVLDGITESKVLAWDGKQDALTDDDKQAIADLHEDPDLSGYVTKEYTDTDIPAHTLDWLVENYPDYCKMTSDTTYVLYLYPGVNIPNGVYVATKYCTFGVRYKLVDSDGVETEKVLTIQLPATWFRYSKVTYQNGAVTHVYESAGKLHFVYMKADGTTTAETNSTVFEYRLADYAKTADLATVATSGSYNDLSDKPDDSTVDVQISGTSITENGVANIPTAYGARKGVVWCGGDKGVTSNSDGQLSLSPATNSQITSRNTEKAITPAQIDYAVKAAMTDGAGDEWTETEKESARERIGLSIDDLSISVDDDGDVVIGGNVVHYGGGEWTKVTEITITEDDTASATSIPFGDDIYCNRLIVIVDESGTSGTTYSSVRFGVLEASRSVARAVLGNTAGAWKSDCKWKTIEFECVGSDMIKYSVTSEVQLNGYVATPQVGRVISSGAQDMSKIGGLYYYGKFSAGTKMTVYGVLV